MKKFLFLLQFLFINSFANPINPNNFFLQIPLKSYSELKSKNLIKQQYDFSCGAASLATLLTYYLDEKTSEKEILDFLFPDIKDFTQKQEISFLDLANFSKSKGFKALGLSIDFSTLLEVKVPVIVYLLTRKNQHFSVFIGADKNFIYLADPSFGNIKIKYKKFKEMFTPKEKQGKVLAIFPKTKIKEIMLDSKKSNHINENIKNKMIY